MELSALAVSGRLGTEVAVVATASWEREDRFHSVGLADYHQRLHPVNNRTYLTFDLVHHYTSYTVQLCIIHLNKTYLRH